MVGHVGTVSVSETIPATINTNVKNLWNLYAQALPNAHLVRGFNPVATTVPDTDGAGQRRQRRNLGTVLVWRRLLCGQCLDSEGWDNKFSD